MSCRVQVCVGGDRLGPQCSLEDAAACMCLTADYCEWELCGWAQAGDILPVPVSGSCHQLRLQPV